MFTIKLNTTSVTSYDTSVTADHVGIRKTNIGIKRAYPQCTPKS